MLNVALKLGNPESSVSVRSPQTRNKNSRGAGRSRFSQYRMTTEMSMLTFTFFGYKTTDTIEMG